MCREWSCSPREVWRHDWETVMMHLEMHNIEKRVRRFRDQKATGQ